MSSETVSCGWLDVGSDGLGSVTLSAKEGQYTLRAMRASDYEAVRALLPLVSRCEQRVSETDLNRILSQKTYLPFCCFEGSIAAEGPLCGFCELYIMPHWGRAADARLERVVVAAEHRGKGLATAMCEAVLQLARHQLQVGRVDLTVEKPDAKHIYLKLGFQPVNTETLRLQL